MFPCVPENGSGKKSLQMADTKPTTGVESSNPRHKESEKRNPGFGEHDTGHSNAHTGRRARFKSEVSKAERRNSRDMEESLHGNNITCTVRHKSPHNSPPLKTPSLAAANLHLAVATLHLPRGSRSGSTMCKAFKRSAWPSRRRRSWPLRPNSLMNFSSAVSTRFFICVCDMVSCCSRGGHVLDTRRTGDTGLVDCSIW